MTKEVSPLSAPDRKGGRSPAVFGLRGLAAVALLTVHVAMFAGLLGTSAFGTVRPPSNPVGAFFVSGLPSFIGVFFVLPALFLYLPMAKAVIAGERPPRQRGRFVRRLFRLLPAYYLMWLVVLVALNRETVQGLWDVLRPFLLLQVYTPSPFVPRFVNGMEITWTVPSMVQWYLALPLIAWATHRYAARGATPVSRARRLMLPVPILVAIGVGWLFFVKAQGWDNRIVFWWPQGFAHAIGIGMALAILLALSQVSPADTPRLFRVAAARPHLFWIGAVVVYLVNCARPFSVIGMDAIYSVSGLLITYLMVGAFGFLTALPLLAPGARRTPVVEAVLTARPVAYLGKISYGIYLWHFAVMHFYLQPGAVFGGGVRPIREFYGQVGFWELQLVTLAGSILFASLSYYLLERPLNAWADARFGGAGRRPPRAARPPRVAAAGDGGRPLAVPGPTLSAPEANALVTREAGQRDTIRANIVDLERSFGRQLLADTRLAGRTETAWRAAGRDLAALWEIFTAYSAVVDEAARLLGSRRFPGGSDLARVTGLLQGPSVELTDMQVPLAQRRIIDSGRIRLTPAEAVERMDELFRRAVETVTAVEGVWQQVGRELERLREELAVARDRATAGRSAALADAAAELERLVAVVRTDPLAFWSEGRPDLSQVHRWRARLADLPGAGPADPVAEPDADPAGDPGTDSTVTGPTADGDPGAVR